MNNPNNTLSIDIKTQWIQQLKIVTEHNKLEYIDIIVDQAGLKESIIPALNKFEDQISWFSLFTDFPEGGRIEQSPILIRIEWKIASHVIWLEKLLDHLYQEPRLLILSSPLPFSMLADFLNTLSEAEWGLQSCLFRFYDPRIFPELMVKILTKEQRHYFSDLAFVWGWLDRDQEMNWMLGSYHPDIEGKNIPALQLTDSQISQLGCISDATRLMVFEDFYDPTLSIEQNFSALYSLALQASENNYFGDFANYVRQQRKIK